ncbi:MAG TPA: mechanosensitive ion channel family protein [Thermoanaerobaculia bacterium]|nr:mechanosensitive ion channel family protein [Thermoanaerobaculia bacterium]HEV8608552.1 mechanosensitive ion channel family protein [Thermoanaerobaculia bacterium]
MKTIDRIRPMGDRVPLVLRRLIGPLALAATVVAVILLLTALRVPTTSPTGDHDYGALAIGIAAALVLTRLLDYLLFDVAFELRRKHAAPALLRQIVSLLVFGIAIAILFRLILGVQLTGMIATSAVLSVVIGLALQDTLGNLFSGLALHLEKSMQVGDMVRSGEIFGTIEQLSWRAIKLRTMEGNVLLIPNSIASRERLEVFPRPGRPIARTLHVGLEYDLPPARAREALEAAGRDLPGVASYPEPTAYLKSFGDFSISYELRYWLEDYARLLELDSQVRERVWYRLSREGIPIAFPLIRQWQWSAGTLAEPSRRGAIETAIGNVDLFALLSDEARGRLANGARERRFAAGETIVREGDRGSSMFIVESGRLGVSVHGSVAQSQKLAVLESGSAFGEISLLTGDPRTATVRALTEATLLEIDKTTLSPILRENPSLCGMLELTMQERRKRSADALAAARGEELERTEDRTPLRLRIARFFGVGS